MRWQESAVDKSVRTHAPVPVGVVCRSNKSKWSDRSNKSNRSNRSNKSKWSDKSNKSNRSNRSNQVI